MRIFSGPALAFAGVSPHHVAGHARLIPLPDVMFNLDTVKITGVIERSGGVYEDSLKFH